MKNFPKLENKECAKFATNDNKREGSKRYLQKKELAKSAKFTTHF
jgi:hypothetical protein